MFSMLSLDRRRRSCLCCFVIVVEIETKIEN